MTDHTHLSWSCDKLFEVLDELVINLADIAHVLDDLSVAVVDEPDCDTLHHSLAVLLDPAKILAFKIP